MRTRELVAMGGLVLLLAACDEDEAMEVDGSSQGDASIPDGSPPDAGRDGAVDMDAAPGCMLAASYTIEARSPLGGSPFRTVLRAPSTYVRESLFDGGARCEVALPACGGPAIDVEDLDLALRAPEVAAALAQGETTHGKTWDFNDNVTWLVVERMDGGRLQIGERCGDQDASYCRVPDDVWNVRRLLSALDRQQLDGGGCVVR